jgi:RNA polymerase sigma-70 factor (ECF subfamily)
VFEGNPPLNDRRTAPRADAALLTSLAARAQRGDEAAFTQWVEHTYPMAFRTAVAALVTVADAEDVVQELYARAWQKLPSLQKPEASVAWLLTMCRRACVDRLRARPRYERSVDEEATTAAALVAPDAPADEVLKRRETKELIARALAELDDDQRAVVVLRDLEGMSAPEIAALLDIPVGTVESRTHRGRGTLKKILMSWWEKKR